MIRRLAIAALGCLVLASPAGAQDVTVGKRSDLYGKWRMVYMDAATCGYGAIVVNPPSPIGRVDALVNVSCGGLDYVYTFEVLDTGLSHFVFHGISTNGPAGIGPNRLQYEFTFNKLDCTLSGRWLVDAPIGRLVLHKLEPC
jgi:hypothetical protein